MSAETAPPILINDDGTIEDGQHRYESAKKRGDKKILAYVIK
jgi:ParB-like chromosome segregation protein Spo0J